MQISIVRGANLLSGRGFGKGHPTYGRKPPRMASASHRRQPDSGVVGLGEGVGIGSALPPSPPYRDRSSPTIPGGLYPLRPPGRAPRRGGSL